MGEASNPGPRVSFISANVTSFIPHAEYVSTLNADILALQEVRLTEDSMRIASDIIKPFHRKAIWGKPQPIRKGTIHSTLDAKQGGVGFLLANHHCATSSPRSDVGNQLFESGRWNSIAVRINSGGLIIHVVTVYGFPRANEGGEPMESNEQLLSDVFSEATSLGNVPVIVLGDFNIKPERSPILSHLVTSGLWCDIGQTYAVLEGSDPLPTFDARGTNSRIDLAFGNPELMRLLKSYEVLDVPPNGIKNHKPVRVVIDVTCPKSWAWQTRKVHALPVPSQELCAEDTRNLEDDIFERYLDGFVEAVESTDVDAIWDAWCTLAETFLAEKTALETGNDKYARESCYRGRGHAAEVSKVKLGKMGRSFEGVELNPEKRGLRKLLTLIEELIHGEETIVTDSCLHQNIWDKAKRVGREVLKYHKCSVFWSFSLVPDLLLLREIKRLVTNVLEDVIAGGRDKAVRKWKKERNERAKSHTGDLFRLFKPLDQIPLTILKKPDGSITGDIQEMDQILRSSWLPIFAKHTEKNTPEPDVGAFMERFGHLIPCPRTETAED